MLEILALVFVCRAVGRIARDKGRGAIGYQVMAVLLWFGFEVVGAVIAAIASVLATGSEEPDMLVIYGGALAGAVFSLLITFGVVKSLPAKQQPVDADIAPVDVTPPNPYAHTEQRPMF